MKTKATPRNGLTDIQAQALHVLLDGETVSETARKIGITRQTVSGWKNGHPVFVAAFNAAMRDRVSHAHAGMLDLAPRAIEVLALELEEGGDTASDAARDILKFLVALAPVQIGPTTSKLAEVELRDDPLSQLADAVNGRNGFPLPETDDNDAERTTA